MLNVTDGATDDMPYSQCRYKSQNNFIPPEDKNVNPDEKVVVTQ